MALTTSRRGFLKIAAATTAAASLAGAATIPQPALAAVEEPAAADVKRIRTCCRGCGKMECGVWVTVQDGRAIKVEGDESAPQSNGNCCAKSQSSMQAAYHPDRLKYPMRRTNPKGGDPGWVRISWDEAYDAVYQGMKNLYDKYGNTTFTFMTGTSRMWGMSSPGYMALVDGINDTGAAQICKGPRREAGALTIENGIHFQALVDRPLVHVQWGTDQSQSNYDDACRTAIESCTRAETFISIDPRKSNMGKEADYHLALRPGTDGAMVMAWTRIVMEEELYDDLLVKRWSNAPFLYVEELEPTGWIGVKNNVSPSFEVKTRLLKESDLVEGGDVKKFMVWDNIHDKLTYFDANEEGPHAGMWEGQTEHDIATTGFDYEMGGWVPDPMPFPVDIDPALWGEFDVTLKDGRVVKAKPVFQKYWDECVNEMTLEKAAEICDVDAQLIYDACKAWATRIDPRRGNGGLNMQLAPEQVGRAIQNFRTMYILAFMTDNYDTPGGNRGVTPATVQAGGCAAPAKSPRSNLPNLVTRAKIVGGDKFPLTKWWNNWVDQTAVWDACHTGEPYPIKGCIHSTGNFMNQSNATYAWEALQQMEFSFFIDLWPISGTQLADILVPARHWLEIPGFARASQGASGGFGATVNCIKPPAETGFEPEILCNIYKRFGVPFYDTKDGGDAWDRPIEAFLDYAVSSVGLTWQEYVDEFQKNGWWDCKEFYPERWGTYRRYQMGYLRGSKGPIKEQLPGMGTPTMKCEVWSTIMESVLDEEELPYYQEPPLSPVATPELYQEYPFNMTTGRRIPVYFHSEHRQLPWCREQWPVPRMEINPEDAAELGIKQGDWVWIESKWGKVRQTADLFYGIKRGVINAEHTWWYPELGQADKGYGLSCINCLVDKDAQDPICGSSQLRAYPVKVYKATPENSPFGNPCPCGEDGTEIIHDSSDPRLKEWLPVYEGRE